MHAHHLYKTLLINKLNCLGCQQFTKIILPSQVIETLFEEVKIIKGTANTSCYLKININK